jgi:hypothetical protein
MICLIKCGTAASVWRLDIQSLIAPIKSGVEVVFIMAMSERIVIGTNESNTGYQKGIFLTNPRPGTFRFLQAPNRWLISSPCWRHPLFYLLCPLRSQTSSLLQLQTLHRRRDRIVPPQQWRTSSLIQQIGCRKDIKSLMVDRQGCQEPSTHRLRRLQGDMTTSSPSSSCR